ncbi:MAG TPA: class I SAM-dependent methyltransferase, partial [Aestuariivirgaceae bacterium]|nr:class I SAM-dependent methyltransferase [Aestuariivirgaceae bacterium]
MKAVADPAPAACPVCRALRPVPFTEVGKRTYWACETCQARFLDPGQYPSSEVELARYRQHQNDPDDPRYRQFLSKLADPLLHRLAANLCGLDYGCGPGPALCAMLGEAGHEMAAYDPFFAPDRSLLERTFDFITCTEAAEHFHHPAAEFDRLNRMLRAGGWLGIMTCFQTDDGRFADWHYRKDPTHVVFYREATMRT